jgi:hypothetical protein
VRPEGRSVQASQGPRLTTRSISAMRPRSNAVVSLTRDGISERASSSEATRVAYQGAERV